MTGFEVELLEQIETGQVQPQLGTLMRLSKALEGAFGRLVSGVGDRLYAITRKDDRKVVSRSTSRKGARQAYTYMSLAPEVQGRHMEALVVHLASNPDQSRSVHEGEEFVYVLDGTVLLEIGGERFELEPGDSAYYLSTTSHLITAARTRRPSWRCSIRGRRDWRFPIWGSRLAKDDWPIQLPNSSFASIRERKVK